MERTVPRSGSDEIDLYTRTYYSLLRSTGEIAIEALVEVHAGMNSSLHPNADNPSPDASVVIYTSLRLPPCIAQTQLVVLGQRRAVFERMGYDVGEWGEVTARARRRRTFFDGKKTLAMYIASRSDIDDIIPMLTAYQIEWNKLHAALQNPRLRNFLEDLSGRESPPTEDEMATLAAGLGVSLDDIERLHGALGADFFSTLVGMAHERKRFRLRLLGGSLIDYRKAMQHWWEHIVGQMPGIAFEDARVYFVSSNTHSLVNMWSGYALWHREEVLDYVIEAGHEELLAEYRDIESNAVPSSAENFLYYALKKYLQDSSTPDEARTHRAEHERTVGIHRAPSEHGFDVGAQVIELGRVALERVDPRLSVPGIGRLRESRALIFNIDYPLGMAAYELLSTVAERVGELVGVYVMGKAATLNARVGDVMIPITVHDEHSQNTYLYPNCFTVEDVAPYLVYGTVLDNQKAVTVRGTFLQNAQYMGVFYREGFTDIEMEAGPYLSAIYEYMRPKRHPQDEIVSLHSARFDIGILHYASDRPLNKGKNLGEGSLSYRGMDPTYATAAAILRRIIAREIAYLEAPEAAGEAT
jgi:hypothetical protein